MLLDATIQARHLLDLHPRLTGNDYGRTVQLELPNGGLLYLYRAQVAALLFDAC